MSGRLISSDPVTKRAEMFYTDPDGGVVIASRQDVEPIIEANKVNYKEQSGFKGDMKHVARIPLAVYEDLMKRGIADDPVKFKAWLNDRDNKAWRTHPGRL